MLPATDPAILTRRALGLDRASWTRGRLIAVNRQPALLPSEAADQALTGGTLILIVVRLVDEITFAKLTLGQISRRLWLWYIRGDVRCVAGTDLLAAEIATVGHWSGPEISHHRLRHDRLLRSVSWRDGNGGSQQILLKNPILGQVLAVGRRSIRKRFGVFSTIDP